jgi:L-ascorbate oxidase
MRAESWCRSLTLLVSAALAAAAAVQAQDPVCEPLPSALPWGQVLHQENLPAIYPVGDELDTSLVIRARDFWVPVFTPNLCQANGKFTYQACSTAGGPPVPPCAPGSTCVNAQTCSDNHQPCTSGTDCTGTGATCVSAWGWQCEHLRVYGSPKDPSKPINPGNPHDPNLRWGYPGPILHAGARTLADPTKPPGPPGPHNPTVKEGTRIKIKLYNYLQPHTFMDAMGCNPATYQTCVDQKTGHEQLYCVDSATGAFGSTCSPQSPCPMGEACLPQNCTSSSPCTAANATCGASKPVPQASPDCFHGDRVTNLHLHGTHTSPQAPQDNILLNLYPFGTTGVPTGPTNPNNAVGSYQMDVNPLPWNQAPGTHWYHPHKHGSTSTQVQTGMGGALIVRGAFDDWLDRFYQGQLIDRVLAVQQISGENQFFNFGLQNFPPTPLVDGYAAPIVKMRPGEIQRLRFVSATTQASATIGFDPRLTRQEVRQIAQDGVQFAWQNFDLQPLGCPPPATGENLYSQFSLAPGGRADFLVQAPLQAGDYVVSANFPQPAAAQRMKKRFNPEPIAESAAPTAAAAGTPPFVISTGTPVLFTIRVGGSPKPMSFPVTQGTDPACLTSPKPVRCWPGTPYFLRDLPAPGTPPFQLVFSINGNAAAQPNSFLINGSQYRACCAALTTQLGETMDWSLSNLAGENNSVPTGMINHVFHIHTNPFQVMSIPNNCNTSGTPTPPPTVFTPPIWQDSLNLPQPTAGTTTFGPSLIRQRFDDYTGAYVLHCHLLGHEDRGMMWNVQTVCPGSLLFGKPQGGGAPDNCAEASAALPRCSPSTQCPEP